MTTKSSTWSTYLAMLTFVLLWGSAGIFNRWALEHGSIGAVLILRFSVALVALLLIGLPRHSWWPQPGTRLQVAAAGLVLVGVYSFFYIQAISRGITPGLLATVLGVQPILTLLLTERRFSLVRLLGLLLALAGLVLVVYQSLILAKMSALGMGSAICAMLCMTFGSMLQKRTQQAPTAVLPLQFVVSLIFYLILVPVMPVQFEVSYEFLLPVVYLGLAISVAAQLLLYRLIRSGNLVNVTSLFYLVPAVTVVLDYLLLGNALPGLAMVGMGAILGGLALVFRKPKSSQAHVMPEAVLVEK